MTQSAEIQYFINSLFTPRLQEIRLRAVSFFFAKLLLYKHASGEAACREKRGRKPENKK